ncbi:MAG: GntR family transcriptional regulator [Syntrophaceae bacterium]|nr:GntR family transcriptional regulator [Syntrophaceae bacterium]
MRSLRKISRKKGLPVREKVYEYLKSAILSGRFDPGTRLAEEHLARETGVSRTPVREALHKLELEGLVKPLETRGFIVSRDSKEEVEELFEIRAVLEGYALRVISQTISDGHLEELNVFIEKAEDALRNGRTDEVYRWNTKFHDTLHQMVTDKHRLHRLMVNVRKYALRYRRNTLKYPDGVRRTIDGHRKIVLALKLRDPELCERVMREHIEEAKQDAIQALFKD